MHRRPFGTTGLQVSILGLGGGPLGDPALDDDEAGRLLNAALDLGVTLIDTAPSYGVSEDRIGRHLRHRRDQVQLSTKGGYGVPGIPDWTGPAISLGIDAALHRLRTDRIDIFHLHSCPAEVALRDDILGALDAALAQGKIRIAAYSGDNEALAQAIASGRFRSIQTSINPFDQHGLRTIVPRAAEAGLGVIAKRPLGNTPWRFANRPVGDYAEVYWTRMRAMGLDYSAESWHDRALRFAAFAPGVSAIITGTRSRAHLAQSAALLARGPLPEPEADAIRQAFSAASANAPQAWDGQI